jgi:hypothetical protein
MHVSSFMTARDAARGSSQSRAIAACSALTDLCRVHPGKRTKRVARTNFGHVDPHQEMVLAQGLKVADGGTDCHQAMVEARQHDQTARWRSTTGCGATDIRSLGSPSRGDHAGAVISHPLIQYAVRPVSSGAIPQALAQTMRRSQKKRYTKQRLQCAAAPHSMPAPMKRKYARAQQ